MNSPNFTTNDLGKSLQLYFRSRDKDPRTIFLIAYIVLGGGCLFLFAVLVLPTSPFTKQFFSLSRPLVYLWLLCFLGFLFLIGKGFWIEISWRLNGKESVEINENSVSIRHQIRRYSITKTFLAKDISCIFISNHKESAAILELLGALKDSRFEDFNYGKIAFNIERPYFHTIRFGSILTPEEAKQVVDIIYDKLPNYKSKAKSAG